MDLELLPSFKVAVKRIRRSSKRFKVVKALLRYKLAKMLLKGV